MALNKQPLDINFALGVDTKTDPFQVPAGKFLSLVNTVFNKAGQLTKRNGFGPLTPLSTTDSVTATTYSNNLVAIGTSFNTLSSDTNQWLNKGPIQPLSLSVVPQVRTNSTQLTVDTAVASNGLACTVWYDSSTNSYYRIVDSVTGQVVVDTTVLKATNGSATTSITIGPKVFCLGGYFYILYWQTVSAAVSLVGMSIPINSPQTPSTPSALVAGTSTSAPFDGFVAPNGNLYISYTGAASTIKTFYITPILAPSSVVSASATPTLISVTAGNTGNIWVTWWDNANQNINIIVYDTVLNVIRTTTAIRHYPSSVTNIRLATSAYNGILSVFVEQSVAYGYTPNSPATTNGQTDAILTLTYNLNTATASGISVLLRGVGLGSKAFYLPYTGKTYFMAIYGGLMQPTYFLSDSQGNIIAKLAYANSAGYISSSTLPQANISGSEVSIGYLYKDLTTPVNKTTPASGSIPSGTQIAGIYNQIGINLASFVFTQGGVVTAELAGSLQTTGGFMWQYDGVKPVEQGFHLYPEDLGTSTATTGGSMTADTYFYVACYEWTDAQGIIHRSAPSVPVTQVVPSGTSTNTVTVNVPYYRLTYKIAPNPVRIVLYRWSITQPVYYQVTSVTAPVTNDPTLDSVAIVDTSANSAILGNTVLYTNDGVVENIAAPAITSITPVNTRLFAIDAEDQNLLWFSKQVIENTPVEMSDLFTLYVAPTISATGPTGPMKCLSAMDDKLIIFKKDAIYYITGTGPDNTGAQNDFSNPIFITSTVGCSNQKSIVFMPNGIMFQSDKGIWLLGRDLSTSYIGAPVEAFNQYAVVAANTIPGTNQVRFRLSNGVTLMYDYYYQQWGTFKSLITAESSTIYKGLETIITAAQTVASSAPYTVPPQVYQETPGVYLDNKNPVLMSLESGWITTAGIQGYERFYQMLLLGNYISPFKLQVGFAYDFNPSTIQSTQVTPETPGPIYGLAPGPYGSGSPYGGNATPFKARVFPVKQKCESFKVTIDEMYDPQYGITAGGGLTLSGMQMLVGVKKGTRTQSAGRSFG